MIALSLPVGACDTHLHVYDQRHPTAATTVLRPPDASADDYRRFQRDLGLQRVVLVQPTTYGLDNACQLEAGASFGDDVRFVVVVDEETPVHELERLDAAGARGARFHMLPGGAVGWHSLEPVAERIADLGWHVQLQLNGRELIDHVDRLLALPTPLVIDHVGLFIPPVSPDDERFGALLALLDAGRCWVKLSAPYLPLPREAPDHPSVGRLARALVAHAPERLLWASNWPHPGHSDPPTADDLGRLLLDWLPDAELRRRILVDHPVEVYGFDPVPTPNHQEVSR